MRKVNITALSYETDDRYYDEHGQPFTGIAVHHHPDGWICGEEEYQEGVAWGASKEWYQSGTLRSEEPLAWGVKHGLCHKWHSNGELAAEAMFEHGIEVWGKKWDENGLLVEQYQIDEDSPDYRLLESFRHGHGDYSKEVGPE